MKLDRRWTGALAFGALVVVIAVPSSEVLNANFAGGAVPAQIAPVAPTARATDAVETASIDPVDRYLATGKPLPDFISGGDSQAEIGPQVTVTDRNSGVKRVIPATGAPVVLAPSTTVAAPPTQVATATPSASTAPVPFPLSMRPAPRTTPTNFTEPAVVAPVTPAAPTMETARVGDEIILPPPAAPSYAVVPPSPGYQPVNPAYQAPANPGYQPFDTTQVARVPSEPADYWEYGPTTEYIGRQPPTPPSGPVTEFANGYADAEGNFYFYEDNQTYQQGYDDNQYQPRRRQPFLQSLFGNN